MNDPAIRSALKASLPGLAIDELGLLCGAIRADVATVDSLLCGYEIKGDGDTLARLPSQAAAYSAVFDRCTLACTPRHVARATAILADWWGITVADGTLAEVRPALPNPSIVPASLVRLLWAGECRSILRPLGCRRVDSWRRMRLWDEVTGRIGVDDIRGHVRAALVARGDWREGQRAERAREVERKARQAGEYERNLAWLVSMVPAGP